MTLFRRIFKGEPITSFTEVKLKTSGMRGSMVWEMLPVEDGAQISCYWVRYEQGEEELVLEERVVCAESEALQLLNDSGVSSWNGFHGEHPKGVLDGIMFRFEATVNDGLTVYADGSANFPAGYRAFTDGVYALLHEKAE